MNTRKLLAVALVTGLSLVAVPMTAPRSAAAPPGCTDLTGGNVTITIGGAFVGFVPPCVIISSGKNVKWSNEDAEAHDPGSSIDGGACFRSVNDLGHEQQPDETYTVKFTYDGVHATATFNVTKNCDAALDDSSTAEEGIIPYICYLHPLLMKGTIVIRS